MGAELVGDLFISHADLDNAAFRVAARMALTAHDYGYSGTPAALYWAGWEMLAAALGREIPEPCGGDQRRCSCEACRARNRHKRAVGRAVGELLRAGVIVALGYHEATGRRIYGLNLGGYRHAGDAVGGTVSVPPTPTSGDGERPPNPDSGDGERPPNPDSATTSGDGERPPAPYIGPIPTNSPSPTTGQARAQTTAGATAARAALAAAKTKPKTPNAIPKQKNGEKK